MELRAQALAASENCMCSFFYWFYQTCALCLARHLCAWMWATAVMYCIAPMLFPVVGFNLLTVRMLMDCVKEYNHSTEVWLPCFLSFWQHAGCRCPSWHESAAQSCLHHWACALIFICIRVRPSRSHPFPENCQQSSVHRKKKHDQNIAKRRTYNVKASKHNSAAKYTTYSEAEGRNPCLFSNGSNSGQGAS